MNYKAPRSRAYIKTLSAPAGILGPLDSAFLAGVRSQCAAANRGLRLWESRNPSFDPRVRWVVDLKYRGPRGGNTHRTPKANAYAVDVYMRQRNIWTR